MVTKRFAQAANQFIIYTGSAICQSKRELLHCDSFEAIVSLYTDELNRRNTPLPRALGLNGRGERDLRRFVNILRALAEHPLEQVVAILPTAEPFLQEESRLALHEFVEGLYNYWRSFERYMVYLADPDPSGTELRPYRAFNEMLVLLAHHVRSLYRDLCENITGSHPRTYRHVAAGCNAGLIAVPGNAKLPDKYAGILADIPFIRQFWFDPPLIIDPPASRRSGRFRAGSENPVEGLGLLAEEWLCYPARVGSLIVFAYFHRRFMGLGCSLANLFELAADEHIAAGPDALCLYGVNPAQVREADGAPVFFDDEANGLAVAAIPGEDRFGYFGYLKKMILTLHNVVMMKRGSLPFHGAMVRVLLQDDRTANIVLIGDTATGKSETLEIFRLLGGEHLREMTVVADDMGSLDVSADGRLLGRGTEIGAFIRLDDLKQGYALGQIDRAVIMSPQKANARVVLPVTSIDTVIRGHQVDYLFYANNYEEVDENHPIVDRFLSREQALAVFREGASLARGDETTGGIGHSYFANPFGPPQCRDLHETLVARHFEAAFLSGVFVGQLRTRIGVQGYETIGPERAAKALLDLITKEDPARERTP